MNVSGKTKRIWIKRVLAMMAVLIVSSLSAYAYEISVYIQATCTRTVTTTSNNPSQNRDGTWNAIGADGKQKKVDLGNADGTNPDSYKGTGTQIPTTTTTSEESYDCSYTVTVNIPGNTPSETMMVQKEIEKAAIEKGKEIIRLHQDTDVRMQIVSAQRTDTSAKISVNLKKIQEACDTERAEIRGDPVLLSSGQYIFEETDMEAGDGLIRFSVGRTYLSGRSLSDAVGKKWYSSLDSRAIRGYKANPYKDVEVTSEQKNKIEQNVYDGRLAYQVLVEKYEKGITGSAESIEQLRRQLSELQNCRYADKDEIISAISETERALEDMKSLHERLTNAYPKAKADAAQRVEQIEQQYRNIKEQLQQLIYEKEHYEANRSLNVKTVRGEGFDRLIESGNDTIQIFDESGYIHLFKVKAAIVYGNGWNHYPDGSECEAMDRQDKSRLTVLADGRMIWEREDLQRWIYGKEGLLERIENLSGYGIDFMYNEAGVLQRIQAGERQLLKVIRDGNGCITSLINQAGQTVHYGYENGILVSVMDDAGDEVRYEYSAGGLLEKIIKPDSSAITIIYGESDAKGNVYVTATEDEEGNRESFEYHRQEKYTVHRNHSGVGEKIWYDDKHRTVKEEKADGSVIAYEYDEKGNKSRVIENGLTTSYTYDGRGNCISIQYADGSRETFQYNGRDQKTYAQDRDGVTAEWVYDSAGRCITVRKAGATIWEGMYDSAGALTGSKEADLGEKRYSYDANGFVRSVSMRENGTELTEQYTNDAIGRVLRYEDGAGQVWTYEYGAKTVTEVTPLGLKKVYWYNNRKDLIAVEEKDSERNESRLTQLSYDRRHLVKEVKDGAGNVIRYEYRADGKVISEKRGTWEKRYEYDSAGRIVKIVQKKAGASDVYETSAAYTLQGAERIQVFTDGLGNKQVYRSDAWSRLTEQVNAAGESFKRQYSAGGAVLTAQGSYGGAYRYGYEAGLATSFGKDGDSAVRRSYSPIGLLLSETDRDGRQRRYRYTERGLLKTISSDEGTISYTYDGAGRVIEQSAYTEANGHTYRTRYRYDGRTVTEERGAYITTYTLDGWGKPILKTNGEGWAERYRYDGAGRISEVRDDIGLLAGYTYNELSLVASERHGTEIPIVYTYNAIGLLEKAERGNEILLTRSYDKAGRLVREKKQGVSEKTYRYDALGRLTEVRSAGEVQAQYRYGSYGKTVTYSDGAGSEYLFEKDSYGLLTTERDRLGKQRVYRYSKEDELSEAVQRNGGVRSVTRRKGAEITTYRDGSRYEIVKDMSGQVIFEKGIDSAGKRTSEVRYRYDEAGQLIEQADDAGDTRIIYRYNKAGYRTEMQTNDRYVVYEIDGRGRVTEITDRKQYFKVKASYDENNREIKRILGNGNKQDYTYDEVGRLLGIVETGSNRAIIRAECYGYDGEGRRIFTADERGNLTRYIYDEQYRIKEVQYPASEELRAYHREEAKEVRLFIDEGAASHRREIMNPVALAQISANFSRLVGARTSNLGSMVGSIQLVWSEQYTYDANGNIATKTTPYGTIHYSYDKENRLLTRGAVHYTYDEEGNLLREEQSDYYLKRYEYAGFNRMEMSDIITYRDNTHVITDYRYDSFGRRIHTAERTKSGMRTIYDGLSFEVVKEAETFLGTRGITSSATGEANLNNYTPHGSDHTRGTRYYYIPNNAQGAQAQHSESASNTTPPYPSDHTSGTRYYHIPNNAQGAQAPHSAIPADRTKGVRTYLYLNGERVAINNLYNTNHGQYYYGSDILGSVKFVTGQGGQELKRIEYDVFGGIYKGNSPYGLETGYTGKPYDSITGLSDYGFRDYSPKYARFITEDPIRDGENWFAYVGNNPVNWVDPWGLSASDGQKNSPTFGSVVKNFGIGFAQGAWGAAKNIGQFIAHPIKTVQATANGIAQFGKNLYNDPRRTYNGIKDSVVGAYTTFKNADANEKARIVGNITGHVAVDTAAIVATGAASKFAVGKVKSLIRGKSPVSLPQALSGGPADTYVYYGKKGGKPVYVGITNDLKRRQMEHGTRFRLEPITKTPLIRGEARAVEQALIKNNPGFQNIRNSISPTHTWYNQAVEWGEQWLRNN